MEDARKKEIENFFKQLNMTLVPDSSPTGATLTVYRQTEENKAEKMGEVVSDEHGNIIVQLYSPFFSEQETDTVNKAKQNLISYYPNLISYYPIATEEVQKKEQAVKDSFFMSETSFNEKLLEKYWAEQCRDNAADQSLELEKLQYKLKNMKTGEKVAYGDMDSSIYIQKTQDAGTFDFFSVKDFVEKYKDDPEMSQYITEKPVMASYKKTVNIPQNIKDALDKSASYSYDDYANSCIAFECFDREWTAHYQNEKNRVDSLIQNMKKENLSYMKFGFMEIQKVPETAIKTCTFEKQRALENDHPEIYSQFVRAEHFVDQFCTVASEEAVQGFQKPMAEPNFWKLLAEENSVQRS